MTESMDALVLFFSGNGMVFELLIATVMFTWWLEGRAHFAIRAIAGILAMVAVSLVWSLYVPSNIMTVIVGNFVIYALLVLWILLCWQVSFWQALFYLIMAGTLQHFAFRGADLTVSVIGTRWDLGWASTIGYALLLVPWLVIGYLCFARPMKRTSVASVGSRSVMALLVVMFLCVSVFKNVFSALEEDPSSSVGIVFGLFDLVTCIVMLALAIELVGRQAAKADGEVMRELLRQQKQQMASSKETIDLINVKTHDLKKQIAQMGSAMSAEQIEELSGLVDIYDASVNTGNEALDVLMAQKSMQCEQRGIRFDRMVDGQLLLFMKPVDLYSLFGNAIDNALEAVSMLDDASDRYISVQVRREKNMAMIRVENPFSGKIAFEDGLPRTTKDDARYHGFGTRSIRMIAEKYDGYMSIAAREGVFRLTVIIPL